MRGAWFHAHSGERKPLGNFLGEAGFFMTGRSGFHTIVPMPFSSGLPTIGQPSIHVTGRRLAARPYHWPCPWWVKKNQLPASSTRNPPWLGSSASRCGCERTRRSEYGPFGLFAIAIMSLRPPPSTSL